MDSSHHRKRRRAFNDSGPGALAGDNLGATALRAVSGPVGALDRVVALLTEQWHAAILPNALRGDLLPAF